MITKVILIEKNAWDLVKTELWLLRENLTLFRKEIKEDQIAIGITHRIIVERVSFQIAFNIIDFEDPRDMWTKFKSIYSEVG